MSEVAIGINLGTTNCAVAYVDDSGQPKIIKNCFGDCIIPSVILFSPSGELIFGVEAKQQIACEKGNTFCYFKRDMGTDTIYPYKDKNYSPVELSSYLLENIKREVEEATGLEIKKAVITVPAYFQDRARLDTKKAGEKAGLEVLNIINEPTAASLAYGLNNPPTKRCS